MPMGRLGISFDRVANAFRELNNYRSQNRGLTICLQTYTNMAVVWIILLNRNISDFFLYSFSKFFIFVHRLVWNWNAAWKRKDLKLLKIVMFRQDSVMFGHIGTLYSLHNFSTYIHTDSMFLSTPNSQTVRWLFGWMTDWLNDWLAEWLTGHSFIWFVGWSVRQLNSLMTGQPVDWLDNQTAIHSHRWIADWLHPWTVSKRIELLAVFCNLNIL